MVSPDNNNLNFLKAQIVLKGLLYQSSFSLVKEWLILLYVLFSSQQSVASELKSI